MQLKGSQIKKILSISVKIIIASAYHIYLTGFCLLFLVLLLGGLLFYKYIIVVQKIKPDIYKKPFQLNEKDYQEVLKIWQEQEKRFNEANFKEYQNPFTPLETLGEKKFED